MKFYYWVGNYYLKTLTNGKTQRLETKAIVPQQVYKEK